MLHCNGQVNDNTCQMKIKPLMTTSFRQLWDTLKSSYWFVPLVMMSLAVLLWLGTSSLDHLLTTRDKKAIAWLYIANEDSMRNLLLTIAGAIVGIMGVVFSIIMIPLSIAASQFGPRLLRTFLRDTGTQVTLGVYTATFIFCMLVLLQLSQSESQPLPQISVNVALLLGLASFGILIYFINHVAISIQAPVLVERVSKELQTAIRHDLPDQLNISSVSSNEINNAPNSFDEASANSIIKAAASGYVQVRDDDLLIGLAQRNNLVLKLLAEPGEFVVKNTAIAVSWPAQTSKTLEKTVNRAFILGSRRTLVQDVTFGINELVEVAVRALSPAINDPFTAMTCLDWLGSAFCEICCRIFPEKTLADENGKLRVIRNPVTFTTLADAAFNAIRENARTSTAVTLRLIQTIKVVAEAAQTEEQRRSLLHHATLVEQGCHFGLPEASDRELVTSRFNEVKEILTRK